MAIRAVLCDLGGVVIKIDPDRIRSRWAELSALPPQLVHSAYPDDVYDSFERDEITEDEYIAHVRDRLSLQGTPEQIRAAFNDLYLGVDEDTVDLLRRLKERGVLVLALTNTNRTHHGVWSRRFAGALDVFEQVHCSHDLRCRKPEPQVFRRVLKAHGLQAGEVVFIDDVPGHVEAAETAGLEALVFTDAEALRRRLEALDWALDDARDTTRKMNMNEKLPGRSPTSEPWTVVIVDGGELDIGEVISLYDAVGWSVYTRTPELLETALANSSVVAIARDDRHSLVGLARALSDDASIFYLQDILVRPEHHRSGVGRQLLGACLEHFAHVRQKVLLTDDDEGQRAFYESFGFTRTIDFEDAPLNAYVRFDA